MECDDEFDADEGVEFDGADRIRSIGQAVAYQKSHSVEVEDLGILAQCQHVLHGNPVEGEDTSNFQSLLIRELINIEPQPAPLGPHVDDVGGCPFDGLTAPGPDAGGM